MIYQPSDKEEEFIKREELQRLKRLRRQAARETAEKEQARLKEQHWMRCPKCGMELAEVEYSSVVVDACFACGGMFLDQGEMEKILGFVERKERGFLDRMISGLFRE